MADGELDCNHILICMTIIANEVSALKEKKTRSVRPKNRWEVGEECWSEEAWGSDGHSCLESIRVGLSLQSVRVKGFTMVLSS